MAELGAATRLEAVTEFVEAPKPLLNEQVLKERGQPDVVDDVTISFGQLTVVRGVAFGAAGDNAVSFGVWAPEQEGVPVLKQWVQLDDGRQFLVESVAWTDARPLLKGLPQQASKSTWWTNNTALARVWPKRVEPLTERRPIQLASTPYAPKGFLLDFTIIPDQGTPTTLASGQTYYVKTSYYSGSAVTFQPGCVIKYKNNAYMLLYGSVSFPATGQLMPVFTSRNDDLFGEKIAGVPGETDSNGDPTLHKAAEAIWIYYVNFSTTIRDVRIRWAQKGINYEGNANVSHYVNDSVFQQCTTGIYCNLTQGSLYLSNVKKCNVTTPVYIAVPENGNVFGSMTDDCGPLYTVASFAGLKQQEDLASVPDTMGAVGPNHFMVILNGPHAVAVFDKYSAVRRSPTPATALSDFFRLTITSGQYMGTYPFGTMYDPRILYDHGSQRWIACAVDGGAGVGSTNVLLAVSKTSDPVGNGGTTWVSDQWTKYLVPIGACNPGEDRLGVDSNGIYITVQDGGPCFAAVKVAALPKAPFINQTAQTVQSNFILDVSNAGGSPIINPAINFDPATSDDPAWFVFEIADKLRYNRLKWVNGFNAAPVWQDNPWGTLTVSQSFYDLVNGGITAPQLGSAWRVYLAQQGDKLMTAMVRKIGGTQYLWTCRQIGVNSAGNNDDGLADRSAVEWFQIQTTPSVSIAATDRIRDNAPTNPKFYYMPSLVVNRNGDMVIGFSGSSANEYISAYYTGRLNNGTAPSAPIRYGAGKDWYYTASDFQWGDYSYTSLDPDGLTMWTIQEYTETHYNPSLNAWGTWIGAVTPF